MDSTQRPLRSGLSALTFALRGHMSVAVDHKTVLARPGIEPGSILLGMHALSVALTGHTANFDVQELHVRIGIGTR